MRSDCSGGITRQPRHRLLHPLEDQPAADEAAAVFLFVGLEAGTGALRDA